MDDLRGSGITVALYFPQDFWSATSAAVTWARITHEDRAIGYAWAGGEAVQTVFNNYKFEINQSLCSALNFLIRAGGTRNLASRRQLS